VNRLTDDETRDTSCANERPTNDRQTQTAALMLVMLVVAAAAGTRSAAQWMTSCSISRASLRYAPTSPCEQSHTRSLIRIIPSHCISSDKTLWTNTQRIHYEMTYNVLMGTLNPTHSLLRMIWILVRTPKPVHLAALYWVPW